MESKQLILLSLKMGGMCDPVSLICLADRHIFHYEKKHCVPLHMRRKGE